MGDVVGRLFREFAITLAVAILISAFVSLTLTPMMAARLLRHTPREQQSRFFRRTGDMFDARDRALRRGPALGARPPAAHPRGVPRDPRPHGDPLHRDPEGLLPRAGHGTHPGHLGGAADGVLRGDVGAQPRASPRRSSRTRRSRTSPPSSAWTAPTSRSTSGRVLIGAEAPRAARLAPRWSCERLKSRLARPGRHRALHAAGAGPHHRGPREPHAIPVHARKRQRAGPRVLDRRAWSSACSGCRN